MTRTLVRTTGDGRRTRRRVHAAAAAAAVAVTALTLTGCSAIGSADEAAPDASGSAGTGTVTVVTHDSFTLSDRPARAVRAGDRATTSRFVQPGDAGTVVNQLVLTKDAPLGDVVFGIDNTFAGRVDRRGRRRALPRSRGPGGRGRRPLAGPTTATR